MCDYVDCMAGAPDCRRVRQLRVLEHPQACSASMTQMALFWRSAAGRPSWAAGLAAGCDSIEGLMTMVLLLLSEV